MSAKANSRVRTPMEPRLDRSTAHRRRNTLSIAVSTALLQMLPCGSIDSALAQSFPPVVSALELDGSNGFRLVGEGSGDQAGYSTSIAGDINGDGIDDILIGALRADANGIAAGSAYLVFGQAGGAPASIDLASLDGTTGFRMDGVLGSLAGRGAGIIGDINADGFDDLAIGAPARSSYTGMAYIVFGSDEPYPAAFDLDSLDGTAGFRVPGLDTFSNTGRSVGAAGDINGDGIDDFFIGAPSAGTPFPGQTYVVFGREPATDGPFPALFDLADLDGTNGFRLDGSGSEESGISASGAGDFNGDGVDDLLIGAFRSSPTSDREGRAYLVFGQTADAPAVVNLNGLDGSSGLIFEGEQVRGYAGFSVAMLGDVNGDGFDDLVIGAYGTTFNGPYSGTAYVVFGRSSPSPSPVALSDLDGTDGFRVDGVRAQERTGRAVGRIGDINGDGHDDLAIGAPRAIADDNYAGSAYILFGRSSQFPAAIDPQNLDGAVGFRVDGVEAQDNTGISVSGSGDVNQDGFDDLIIGANGFDNGAVLNTGASYILFGGASGPGEIPAIAVEPTALSFGDVEIGASATASLRIDSVGTGSLLVSGLSISGANAIDFGVDVDGCTALPVAPAGSCNVDLSFSPTAPGVRRAVLQIESNSPGGPTLVSLAGSNDVLYADGFEQP